MVSYKFRFWGSSEVSCKDYKKIFHKFGKSSQGPLIKHLQVRDFMRDFSLCWRVFIIKNSFLVLKRKIETFSPSTTLSACSTCSRSFDPHFYAL